MIYWVAKMGLLLCLSIDLLRILEKKIKIYFENKNFESHLDHWGRLPFYFKEFHVNVQSHDLGVSLGFTWLHGNDSSLELSKTHIGFFLSFYCLNWAKSGSLSFVLKAIHFLVALASLLFWKKCFLSFLGSWEYNIYVNIHNPNHLTAFILGVNLDYQISIHQYIQQWWARYWFYVLLLY